MRSTRGPFKATIAGERPPQVIQSPALTLNVGGSIVPTLASNLWHPQMVAELAEVTDGVCSYSMSVPDGERFLEWAPEKLDLGPSSDFSDIDPYDLSGIEEAGIG